MKKSTFVPTGIAVLFFAFSAFAQDRFPENPDPSLTPGSVCNTGKNYRYPERVLYCNRDVSSGQKKQIIAIYDAQLGYEVGKMERSLFKIDHYIPLCAGGSNENTNLWPQHESIYRYTDPLEPAICNKMAEGKLTQADAIALVKRAKANVNEAKQVLDEVLSLQ